MKIEMDGGIQKRNGR